MIRRPANADNRQAKVALDFPARGKQYLATFYADARPAQ